MKTVAAITLIVLTACAGREVAGRHVATVADGFWLELRTEYRGSAFGPLRENGGLYFCSDKSGKVVCTLAEFRRNDGTAVTP